MASVSDISELVKALNSLFGEKWGRRMGRAIVIFILVALAGAAIAAIMAGVGAITSWAASNPVTSNILWSLLIMLILAIGILAVGGGLGLFIGAILWVTLSIPMRQNIDSTLEQIELSLLRNGGK
jgi:MFS family permease